MIYIIPLFDSFERENGATHVRYFRDRRFDGFYSRGISYANFNGSHMSHLLPSRFYSSIYFEFQFAGARTLRPPRIYNARD